MDPKEASPHRSPGQRIAAAAADHHLTLNTDGRRHPRENTLAVVALLLGGLSLLSAFDRDLHVWGTVLGLVGVLVGLYDQYISATTAERWVIVPAIGTSAVGFALGMAHGGFGF
jgi:hypothetical protein